MKAADDTFMDDSQDSTLMDTMDENTNMSFDMEGSHQGFPEIPTPKPTKKVTVINIRNPENPHPKTHQKGNCR